VILETKTLEEIQKENKKLRSENRAFRYQIKELKKLTRTDPLTKLGNRKAFEEELGKMYARGKRNPQPFAIIVIDVNLFKEINDEHGHLVGDDVLVGIGEALMESQREGDIVIRFGGDEFACIAYNTDRQGAVKVGERFYKNVNQRLFYGKDKKKFSVSVSVGVSSGYSNEDPRGVIKNADDALYEAKKSPNKVCVR